MGEPPVILEGVTKKFGEVVAVEDISLSVKEREVFGLLGPNGSGKTTTMRIILGLLEPTSGKVRVLGYNMPSERDKVIHRIGYVPQKFGLYEDLTVLENLEFYGRVFNLRGQKLWSRIKELIEDLELWEYRHRLAGKLSGGTRQRLAIAASLIHDPELIILDEPTAGVDPPLRRYFWEVFKKLKSEGKTLIVTTHYMDEAERCDRLAVMRRGKIAALGTPLELKRKAIGGDLVEVVTEPEALSVFSNTPTILSVENVEKISENSIRIVLLTSEGSRVIPEIVEMLKNRNIRVLGVREVYVEFEEVFIRLTSETPAHIQKTS